MTRIAFIGDVHGYAPALQEALDICREEGVTEIYGLGDFIDGYDEGDKTVKLVRETFTHSVWGNHDENHSSELKPENDHWLKQRPQSLTMHGWLITHSSPRPHRQGEKIKSAIDAWSCFDDCDFQRCVVGHAHRPRLYRYAEDRVADCDVIEIGEHEYSLNPEKRYLLVNPSLAYNRSGNPCPGFSIFDNESQTLRVIYLKRDPIIDSYCYGRV